MSRGRPALQVGASGRFIETEPSVSGLIVALFVGGAIVSVIVIVDAARRPPSNWADADLDKTFWITLAGVCAILCGPGGLIIGIIYASSLLPRLSAAAGQSNPFLKSGGVVAPAPQPHANDRNHEHFGSVPPPEPIAAAPAPTSRYCGKCGAQTAAAGASVAPVAMNCPAPSKDRPMAYPIRHDRARTTPH